MDHSFFDLEEGEVENPSVIPNISETLRLKISRAMLFTREWFGEGSLAQVWVPIKSGEKQMLTTSDRLFFLYDDTLSGYRHASTMFTFAAESSSCSLPGRVFASKLPEWTSKVSYYNHDEFSRMHLALQHKVCGSLTLPIFEDLAQTFCCAVLELVTTNERPNFDTEMEAISQALQVVELSSRQPPVVVTKSLSVLQNAALGEIKGVLYSICRTLLLPLALTWVPCDYNDPNPNTLLCADAMASYWEDINMEGFVHACITHPLKPGQGIAGKSLQSNQPLFHHDVKEFHISDYPLVHHARRSGLGAAIAIKIRSAYTGTNDYVLEFFFYGRKDMIASTIERIFRSLIQVPNIQLLDENDIRVELLGCDHRAIIQPPVAPSFFRLKNLSAACIKENEAKGKKRSSIERSISLGELHQYLTTGSTSSAASNNCLRATIKRMRGKKETPRRTSLENTEKVVEGGSKLDLSKANEESADVDKDAGDKDKAPVKDEGSTSFNKH